jgi:hypothetical protein
MNQQSPFTIEVSLLQRGRYTFPNLHKYTPRLHRTPQKDLEASNATIGHGGGATPAKFRRAGGTPGRGGGRARQ